MGKTQEEINKLLSLHPLTKNRETGMGEDKWEKEEQQPATQREKWSEETDPKETNLDIGMKNCTYE